jgi:hypothetical protein
VKESDGLDRGGEMAAATSVITQDSPVLESGNGVLDTGTALAVLTPRPIADDPVLAEDRRDELWNAAVAAVGKDSLVVSAYGLDAGLSIVNDIVAISWTAGSHGDHAQIGAADDDLRVARPAVILRLGRYPVITRRYEGSVDDP